MLKVKKKVERTHLLVDQTCLRDVQKMTANTDISVIFRTSLETAKKTGTRESSNLSSNSSSNLSSNFLDVVVGRAVNTDICHFLDVPQKSEKNRVRDGES